MPLKDLKSNLDSSSIELESDFSLFNTDEELEGGGFKINNSSDDLDDTSTIGLDSDFNLSDSEMDGGKYVRHEDSSDYMNDTSSVTLDSEFNLSSSEMNGGFDFNTALAGSAALGLLMKLRDQEDNSDLKEIVMLSTRILANLVKLISQSKFYQEFNLQKNFLNNYNRNMGEFLLNQSLSDLNNREKLKNIINLNTISLIELKELIEKNSPEVLKSFKIVKIIKELMTKLPKL